MKGKGERERRGESLHLIRQIPLEKRKEKKKCSLCAKTYVCDCRLQNHYLESHKRHPAQSLRTVCPFCMTGLENKCALLMHVFMKHSYFKDAAKVALEERGHCSEKYSFVTKKTYCDICY